VEQGRRAGSKADIDDAEALWTVLQTVARMVGKRGNVAAPARDAVAGRT
jgi:hypothetical protein